MGDTSHPEDTLSEVVKITARTLGGRELQHEVLAHQKVYHLRARLARELKVPVFTLRLIFQGETLDERATFHSLGMSGEVEITLVKVPSEKTDDYRGLLRDFANAVEGNREDDARELLDQGAGHDAEGNLLFDKGSSALHLSVRGCLVDLVKYLIQTGVDLEARNENQRTPLIQACIKNRADIVETLLQARACVNSHDSAQRTALYYALMKDNKEIVGMLRDAGMDAAEIEKLYFMMDDMEQRASPPSSCSKASASCKTS